MRDREATCRKIVDAVGRLLASEGFRGVGVRAVAREAGVDKRLIYRYFGGLPKLMKAYADSGDFWWTVDELIGEDLPGPERDTAAAWVALALKRHLQALKRRPLTQEILVWELSERNTLTDELSVMRECRAAELFERLGEKIGGGGFGTVEWRAVGALIGAATTYLVVRSRTCDSYAGIDLHSEEGWAELERGIDLIVAGTVADVALSERPAARSGDG